MFYSDLHQAEIDRLFDTIKNDPVSMAVVDYLGRVEQNDKGEFVQILHDDPSRFGVRDMGHVKIYDLTVVKKNSRVVFEIYSNSSPTGMKYLTEYAAHRTIRMLRQRGDPRILHEVRPIREGAKP